MLSELQQISAKYEKICNYALDTQQKNKNLESNVESLKQELVALQQNKSLLEQHNKNLENDISNLKQEIMLLRQNTLDIEQNNQVSINTIQNLQHELVQLQEDKQQLIKDYSIVNTNFEDAQNCNSNLVAHINDNLRQLIDSISCYSIGIKGETNSTLNFIENNEQELSSEDSKEYISPTSYIINPDNGNNNDDDNKGSFILNLGQEVLINHKL